MSEELKEAFIKQMLLPKEELAIQTMELLADKMELENIIKEVRNKIENTTINCDGVADDLIDDILEILDKSDKNE